MGKPPHSTTSEAKAADLHSVAGGKCRGRRMAASEDARELRPAPLPPTHHSPALCLRILLRPRRRGPDLRDRIGQCRALARVRPARHNGPAELRCHLQDSNGQEGLASILGDPRRVQMARHYDKKWTAQGSPCNYENTCHTSPHLLPQPLPTCLGPALDCLSSSPTFCLSPSPPNLP